MKLKHLVYLSGAAAVLALGSMSLGYSAEAISSVPASSPDIVADNPAPGVEDVQLDALASSLSAMVDKFPGVFPGLAVDHAAHVIRVGVVTSDPAASEAKKALVAAADGQTDSTYKSAQLNFFVTDRGASELKAIQQSIAAQIDRGKLPGVVAVGQDVLQDKVVVYVTGDSLSTRNALASSTAGIIFRAGSPLSANSATDDRAPHW